LGSILSQMNQVHTLSPNLNSINFNITLSSTLSSCNWPLPFRHKMKRSFHIPTAGKIRRGNLIHRGVFRSFLYRVCKEWPHMSQNTSILRQILLDPYILKFSDGVNLNDINPRLLERQATKWIPTEIFLPQRTLWTAAGMNGPLRPWGMPQKLSFEKSYVLKIH
jgi:hypothetical protein